MLISVITLRICLFRDSPILEDSKSIKTQELPEPDSVTDLVKLDFKSAPDPVKPDPKLEPDPVKPDRKSEPDPVKPDRKSEPDSVKPDRKSEPDPVKPDRKSEPDPVKPDPKSEPDPVKPDRKSEPDPEKPDPKSEPDPVKPDPKSEPDPVKPDPKSAPDPVKPDPKSAPDPVKPDLKSAPDRVKPDPKSEPDPVKPDPKSAPDPAKPVRKSMSDPITVLNFFYLPQAMEQTNYKSMCNLTFDCIFSEDGYHTTYHWTKYSAILVFGNHALQRIETLIGNSSYKRNPEQIWIARGMESSISGLNFNGMNLFGNLFNLTAALSPKSTFQDSYFTIVGKKELNKTMSHIEKEYDELKKDKDFCWMVSQCKIYNKRFDIATEIINNLPGKVHMWGTAVNECMPKLNKTKIIDHGPTERGTENSEFELSKCKFYFAFENSNCSDYVTEKFSNALVYYAIPIVNGWRETYAQQLPGSFIHVSDFEKIRSLVEYLTSLLVDRKKFFTYHKWRLRHEVLREDRFSVYNSLNCRICEKTYKIRESNKKSMRIVETIPNLGRRFDSFQKCVPR